MPFLMHIGFDNNRRLKEDSYCFQYKNVKFKLIQNNSERYQDVLLTITQGTGDDPEHEKVFKIAGEYLSALSWDTGAKSQLNLLGGSGIPKDFDLREAKCRNFSFHTIPFQGEIKGYEIDRIAYIENEVQARAITLYRQAYASNNQYLSFLFYWHVLTLKSPNPRSWIDRAFNESPDNKFYISDPNVFKLDRGRKSFGEYLYDDCRNAIAHIHRPAKTELRLDDLKDQRRIAISTEITQKLAKHFIIRELGLNKQSWLTKKNPSDHFPSYEPEKVR